MKPILAVVNGSNIIEIRNIADEEYQIYKSAATILMQHSSDQQLYKIVEMNYEAFKRAIEVHLLEFKEDPSLTDWEKNDSIVLNINCYILNFLSSVRTFLDHSETIIKRRYGQESGRIQKFKDICAQVHDSNFSYRFLYKLRNYTQHCGLPLGSIVKKSSMRVDEISRLNDSISILFSRDELLENYDSWGKRLDNEIKSLPEEFEITPHVDEVMNCISHINLKLLDEERQNLSQSIALIQDFISETSGEKGVPCILRFQSASSDGSKLKGQFEWIPLHLINQIKSI